MKIRNIVFSGFMASILMAGGAYATATTAGYLTTKAYVDSAYQAAVSAAATDATLKANAAQAAAEDYTDELANGAVATNTQAIANINNETTGILAQAQKYADDQDTAKIGTLPADTTVMSYIGTLPTGSSTVVEAITNAVSAATGESSELSTDVAELKNLVGNSGVTTADLTKLHGVTADVAELNILDGATVTTTELNYVNGVTSNIQNQLDGKVGIETGKSLVSNTDITQITTNKNNITTLMGNASTPGSVAAAVADARGNTIETVETNAAAISALQENTACEEGKLCYINDEGKAVVIDTISDFDDGDLDVNTGA